MPLDQKRFFHCRHCGHKMRFGRHECGACYQPAAFQNRYGFWFAVVLAVLVATLAILAS